MRFARWRIGPLLGGLHLALMCVTVVVTGNHYVLDIVGGLVVAGSAILVGRLVSSVRFRQWWQERRPWGNTTDAPTGSTGVPTYGQRGTPKL